jgi:hypothetical protein
MSHGEIGSRRLTRVGRLADLALGGDFLQQSVHALQVLRWVLGDYRPQCETRTDRQGLHPQGSFSLLDVSNHTTLDSLLEPLVSRVYIKCILARVRVVLVVGKSWGLEEGDHGVLYVRFRLMR